MGLALGLSPPSHAPALHSLSLIENRRPLRPALHLLFRIVPQHRRRQWSLFRRGGGRSVHRSTTVHLVCVAIGTFPLCHQKTIRSKLDLTKSVCDFWVCAVIKSEAENGSSRFAVHLGRFGEGALQQKGLHLGSGCTEWAIGVAVLKRRLCILGLGSNKSYPTHFSFPRISFDHSIDLMIYFRF